MKLHLVALPLLSLVTLSLAQAAEPRALPEGTLPQDVRLQPLKTLHGEFPFVVPKTAAEWEARAAYVRRQVLVAEDMLGLFERTARFVKRYDDMAGRISAAADGSR